MNMNEGEEHEDAVKLPARAVYQYLPYTGELGVSDLEQLTADYFDQEAAEYDLFDVTVKRRGAYLDAIDGIVGEELLRTEDCARILSFGCGTGRREVTICRSLANDPEIVGVETSPLMAAQARARGLAVFRSLEQVLGAFGDGSFAFGMPLYSFPHLPDRASRVAALRTIKRLLRPGAILTLDVFNLGDRFEWASKLDDGGWGSPPPQHGQFKGEVLYRRAEGARSSYMHYFSVGEITSLLEDCGFLISRVVGVGHGRNPGEIVNLDEGCIVVRAIA